MPHRKNSLKNIAICFLLLIVAFSFGMYIGYNKRPWIEKVAGVSNKEPEVVTTADFEPFWKTWNLIDEKSPDAKKVTDQARVWGAISGLVSSLDDPYSVFFPPTESKEFQDEISGEFSGVGMEVGIKDKILMVIAPLKGTPAEKAGIKSGDKILKIGDTSTADLSIDKAIQLIRGDRGTKIKLTILHEGESVAKEIELTRDTISVPTIEGKLRDDGVYVISLYSFSAQSAELFKGELQKFTDSKSTKLVLDLRGNPGGYLDAAVDIASWFLPQGKTVVIENFGDKKDEEVYRSKGYNDDFGAKIKMVILVDGGSASASEILAGALKENGIATLVGEKTYGKGSVQELIPITKDTSLKITIAKWLTPNRNSISEKGLTPDYTVAITRDDIVKKKDPQLNKAIEILNKK